jgi:hypothetical protein
VATVTAVLWKIGPLSEATIGHVGLYSTVNKWGLPVRDGNRTGLNDYVLNEVGGIPHGCGGLPRQACSQAAGEPRSQSSLDQHSPDLHESDKKFCEPDVTPKALGSGEPQLGNRCNMFVTAIALISGCSRPA